MFRDLRTSTKLLLLCAALMASVLVATYQLVVEKRLAIEFAQKELSGTRFLSAARDLYSTMLTAGRAGAPAERSDALSRAAANLQSAEAGFAEMETAELVQALTAALTGLADDSPDAGRDVELLDVLARSERLVARIGDASNLTLDPDLDSYYLQNTVVTKLPVLLGDLAILDTSLRRGTAPSAPSDDQAAPLLLSRNRLRTTGQEIGNNFVAAFRVNAASASGESVGGALREAVAAGNAYLDAFDAGISSAPTSRPAAHVEAAYDNAVAAVIDAWAVTQAELERLLHRRIDNLAGGLRRSLVLIGALVALSVFIAVMTHRHIVGPLERLEGLARSVHATMDYSLRSDYVSRDEIGRLATAFNEMLSELASAREREASSQSELARVGRLTAVGAMAASIAHEINQPLAAIVTNSNAATRWLASATPDLGEVRAALGRIAADGHRASQIIAGIRALFRNDGGATTPLALNDIILDVLALLQGELRRQGVVLRTELAADLPAVSGNRVQLQQVLVNLVMNAIEAMGAVPGPRLLLVGSAAEPDRVVMTIEDSGPGIDPASLERIFDAFYTTKAEGTGMGLAICRIIVQTHGGELWVSQRNPTGSIFHLALPTLATAEA
jgi:signal transduction histidine kinase